MNVCQWCGAKPGEQCTYPNGALRRRAHPGRYQMVGKAKPESWPPPLERTGDAS